MSTASGKNRRATAIVLTCVVAGMVGLSFASVPLYRLFCKVTGYGGTPKTEDVAQSETISDEMITVRFDSNVSSKLPWDFKPVQHEIQVRLGEETLIHYSAENRSADPVVGMATYSVTPFKAAPYFNKIDCFCFTEQRLNPGEKVSMPVLFYVDPEIFKDPGTKDVRKITLSYTFYRADAQEGESREAPSVVAAEPADS